jgi:hypothetical protein
MKIGTVFLGSASLVLLVAAVAQTAPAPQTRIAQGVKGGPNAATQK